MSKLLKKVSRERAIAQRLKMENEQLRANEENLEREIMTLTNERNYYAEKMNGLSAEVVMLRTYLRPHMVLSMEDKNAEAPYFLIPKRDDARDYQP